MTSHYNTATWRGPTVMFTVELTGPGLLPSNNLQYLTEYCGKGGDTRAARITVWSCLSMSIVKKYIDNLYNLNQSKLRHSDGKVRSNVFSIQWE